MSDKNRTAVTALPPTPCSGFWRSMKNPPKCGQTVIALLDWGDRGYVITTVYVVKVRGRRRYGCSPYAGEAIKFRQHDAERAFPANEIIGWRETKFIRITMTPQITAIKCPVCDGEGGELLTMGEMTIKAPCEACEAKKEASWEAEQERQRKIDRLMLWESICPRITGGLTLIMTA